MNPNLWLALGALWAIGTAVGLFILRTRDVVRILGLAADMAWLVACVTIALSGIAALLERGPVLLGISSDILGIILIAVVLRTLVLLKEHHERSRVSSSAAVGDGQ